MILLVIKCFILFLFICSVIGMVLVFFFKVPTNKDLKVFQTIAKEESITKASRILYMTPQGISKIVKNLEAEMGCRLFTRNKAGMLLTESGKRFLEYADKDIADYYQVKKDILHIEQRQKKV